MKLKNILLVEDNPNDVELTLNALKQVNLANRVEVVNDGVEAMEYLQFEGKYKNRQAEPPAFILLDNKMPKMNGIEVLEQIKKDPSLKTIPVVMLTSSKENSDLLQTYSLGVNAYIVKPVDFKQFVYAVKQLAIFWANLNELPVE